MDVIAPLPFIIGAVFFIGLYTLAQMLLENGVPLETSQFKLHQRDLKFLNFLSELFGDDNAAFVL